MPCSHYTPISLRTGILKSLWCAQHERSATGVTLCSVFKRAQGSGPELFALLWSWTFWPAEHRCWRSEFGTSAAAPSTSAPPKAVSWAPCCTPLTPMIVQPPTTPTPPWKICRWQVIGLISNDMEIAYLEEVESLASWCKINNFGTPIVKVSSYRYLRVKISKDLTC